MYSWQILKQCCKGHFVFFHSFILFKLRLSLRYCFSISIGFLFRCHCVCLNLPVSHIRIFCSCYTFNITKILEQLTYWFHERLHSVFSLFCNCAIGENTVLSKTVQFTDIYSIENIQK